jgi:hypothetical protein
LRKISFPTMLLVCLLALGATSLPTLANTKPKVVIHAKGALEPDIQLQAILDNITWVDWVVVMGELTAADIAGAQMLILVRVDSQLNFTDAELTAIENWFNTGGKAIWVSADSDYGDDRYRLYSGNVLLEQIGSVLRFEDCETVDPVTNAGADYRVFGLSENCDPEVEFLVAGVTRALFHGPGLVIGYYNGEYHKLEAERPSNVFIVMASSATGTVAELNDPPAEAHAIGDTGTFPMLVLEIDYANKNLVFASADALFDGYTSMYMPQLRNYERYGVEHPEQGAELFTNILKYVLYYANSMLTQHNQMETLEGQITTLQEDVDDLEAQVTAIQGSVTMWQGVAVVLLVVGLAAGFAVAYFMKK